MRTVIASRTPIYENPVLRMPIQNSTTALKTIDEKRLNFKITKKTKMKVNFAEILVPFGGSATPVDNPDRTILGGKGLGLQEMSRIGVDVPPGFT